MKRLLVVIDYQNDFVNGSLGFLKAVSLEKNICEKICFYKSNKWDVLDTHYDNQYEVKESLLSDEIKETQNLKGWKLFGKVDSLATKDTVKISKHTFGTLDLCEYLIENQYDFIEFVGVVTNICVIANAILAKSALPEAEIVIDASCVASNDEDLHEKALDVMDSIGFKIINR